MHYGSHSFGHYVAFRRRPCDPLAPPPNPLVPPPDGPEWYRISDETVHPARLEDALRSNPFLLFYERVRKGVGDKLDDVTPRLVESWGLGRGQQKAKER